MGFLNFLKDIIIFICVLPLVILFLFLVLIFSIYKSLIFIILSIFYNNKLIRFLTPLDLYFISLENKFNFYRNPRKVLPITIILDGQLSEEELKERFQKEVIDFRDKNGSIVYKRLQQKLVKKFGYILFTRDENFNINNHIRTLEIPLNEKSMLDLIKTETCSAFKPNSSMWEIICVPNYNGENKTFLLFRVHHTFMDGFSILSIFKRGCDNGDKIVPNRNAAASSAGSSSTFAEKMESFYRNTIALPRKFIQEQRSRRNLKPKFISKKFFVETAQKIPLSHFKMLKEKSDVSFTLAITTAVCSALSNTLVGRAIPLLGFDYITGMFTFPSTSQSGAKDVGNSFILADINLPLTQMTLENRIRKCREEILKTKDAVSPKVIGIRAQLGIVFPSFLFMKYFVPSMSEEEGIIIGNMPGPPVACKFWGRDVLDMSFLTIACENPWLIVSILSYAGGIRIGLTGISHVFETEEAFRAFTDDFLSILDTLFNNSIV